VSNKKSANKINILITKKVGGLIMKTIKNINSLEIVRVSDDKAVKMVEGYMPRQWMYVGKQEWKNKVRDVEKIGRITPSKEELFDEQDKKNKWELEKY
jgi:hypothetical protein